MRELNLVVYHDNNKNGDNTVFNGDSLVVSVTDTGSLRVDNWTTNTSIGYTVFAPGKWSCFFMSERVE